MRAHCVATLPSPKVMRLFFSSSMSMAMPLLYDTRSGAARDSPRTLPPVGNRESDWGRQIILRAVSGG
jgi:hypothetical protein